MDVGLDSPANAAFYRRRAGRWPVEVRDMGERRGKGVCAARPVVAGDVAFADVPFASMRQAAEEGQPAHCIHCHRPVHGAARSAGSAGAASGAASGDAIPCPGACHQLFCSEGCRDLGWSTHHRFLCPSRCRGVDSHPLSEFNEHAVARIVDAYQRGCSFDDAVRPFALLHKRMWWEVAVHSDAMGPKERAEEEGPYRYLCAAAAMLLCRAFCGADPRQPKPGELRTRDARPEAADAAAAAGALDDGGDAGVSIDAIDLAAASAGRTAPASIEEPPAPGLEYLPCFQAGFVALLVGAFEMNNISIEFPFRAYGAGDGDEHEFEGTGVFPLVACLNHACRPNATVVFPDESHRASVVTLRDVEAGEELTISYIDEDAPLEERQSDLEDYGFVCDCTKCVEERE